MLRRQGLLGGLGFTNLMMTYFSSPNINLTGFLRYYSPMAMVLNRFYYVLVCFALVATINKCAPALQPAPPPTFRAPRWRTPSHTPPLPPCWALQIRQEHHVGLEALRLAAARL